MDAAISKVLISLLEQDRKVENKLKEIVREVKEADWKYRFNKFGAAIGAVLIAAVSSILTIIVTKWIE